MIRRIPSLLIVFIFSLSALPGLAQMEASDNPQLDEVLTEKGIYQPLGQNRVNLRIENKQFRVYVVDGENVVQEPEFEAVFIEVIERRGPNEDWRGLLKASTEGPYMTHPRRLFGVYQFQVRMILRYEDKDPVVFGRLLFQQE